MAAAPSGTKAEQLGVPVVTLEELEAVSSARSSTAAIQSRENAAGSRPVTTPVGRPSSSGRQRNTAPSKPWPSGISVTSPPGHPTATAQASGS